MTLLRTLALVGVLSGVAGLLGACGSSDGTASDGTPTTADALDGRSFLSQQLLQGGSERPQAGDEPLSLAFVGGTLTAWAGCNTMSGPYTVTDGKLLVESMATTEMACDAALMAQEQWLAGVLSAEPWVSLDGVSLSLGTDDSTLLFVDRSVARPAPPLQGTTWLLTTLIDADIASSIPDAITSTLLLDGDRLALKGACNRGGAEATVEGDVLTVGNIMMTKMACDPETQSVDQFIIAVLGATPTVRIEGQDLYVDAGGKGLVYVAQT